MSFFNYRTDKHGACNHVFEARYSEETHRPDEFLRSLTKVDNCNSLAVLVKSLTTTTKTYHGDVCVRCGEVVNKQGGS